MSVINKPDELVINSNIEENWRVFRREFENYVTAAGLEFTDDERKVALLLNFAGTDAHEILKVSNLVAEDKMILHKVMQYFEDRFIPKTNKTLSRFTFFSRSQREGESFNEFYSALEQLAEDCEFDTQKNLLIRDQIVIGIQNQKLRKEFLITPHLSLEEAVEQCRNSETVKEDAKKRAEAEIIADAPNFTDDTWTAAHHDVRSDFRKKKTPSEFNNAGRAF